jgi:regulatory protein
MMLLSKITVSRSGNQAQLFIDGREAFKVDKETVRRLSLTSGQELTPSSLQYIRNEDIYSQALRQAARLIKMRPRSAKELGLRLNRRFPKNIVSRLIQELKTQNIVNDHQIASMLLWLRQEQGYKSLREIEQELHLKGFERSLVRELIQKTDRSREQETALRLARRKARLIKTKSRQDFFQKVGRYLQGKGFAYETIRRVLTPENFPEMKR